jgi:hypothetical protein
VLAQLEVEVEVVEVVSRSRVVVKVGGGGKGQARGLDDSERHTTGINASGALSPQAPAAGELASGSSHIT